MEVLSGDSTANQRVVEEGCIQASPLPDVRARGEMGQELIAGPALGLVCQGGSASLPLSTPTHTCNTTRETEFGRSWVTWHCRTGEELAQCCSVYMRERLV